MENNFTMQLATENSALTQFKKFNKVQWNKIEKVFDDPITNYVLETTRKLGNDNIKLTEIQYKYCGNNIYTTVIRPLLFNKNILNKDVSVIKEKQTKTKKKNKKAGNKLTKEEIIQNNIINGVTKNVEEAVKTYDMINYNPNYGFNSQYAEIKFATLLYAVHFWTHQKAVNLEQCYELYVGVKKILHYFVTNKNLSQIAYTDLSCAHTKLKTYCNFTYETMCSEFPRLCLTTNYDTIFKNLAIQPYESQIKLMNAMKAHKKSLILYKAMIGTGKTTITIALAEYVIGLRASLKATNQNEIQLLFACSVEPVRHQVCRMAYNQQIPFGVATIGDDKVVKVTNNFNCKSDNDRILIVSDLDCAIELLNKSQNYMLFVDEPTVGADQQNHPVTKAVSKLMILAPEKTILCSATLPDPHEIPSIISCFKEKHQSSVIESIYSKESLIGCELITPDGYTFLPHNNCTSVAELKIIIENLKTKPFIDRLYTAPVLYRLTKRMSEYNVPNILDLEKFFNHTSNLTQTNIQKGAIELLENLVILNDDSIIKKVCEPLEKVDKIKNIKDENTDSSEGFAWDESNESDDNSKNPLYDITKIFTDQAHLYMGNCLVISNDPTKFAFDNSKELLNGCDSATKIISKYVALETRFKQSLERLDSIKNEDDRSKKEQEIRNEHNPKLEFPSELQVNTLNHLMKFSPYMKDKIDNKLFQFENTLENISLDFNIPDWVMLLLFSKIGIYSPHTKSFAEGYIDSVLNMTANGQLAFLIACISICYGANYPFNHIIINDDAVCNNSIGTIVQALGRTGRPGQSWVGFGHIGPLTAARIMNYFRGIESDGISEEAKNLNMAFQLVLQEIRNSQPIKKITYDPKIQNIVPLSKVVPIKQEVIQNSIETQVDRKEPSKADVNSDWRNKKKPWEHKQNIEKLEKLAKPSLPNNTYVPPFRRTDQDGRRPFNQNTDGLQNNDRRPFNKTNTYGTHNNDKKPPNKPNADGWTTIHKK